jgi:hypothetical protein
VAALIVTGAVPEEVNVTGSVAVELTATLPKVTAVGLTVNRGVVVTVPVPLRATLVVPPLAESLLTVNCPAATPATVGLNLACSVTVWFGLSVIGKVAPDTLKAAPVNVAALIVTGAVPEEVNVTGSVAVELTATLPKVTAVGVTVNRGVVVTVPVPVRATLVVPPLVESLLTVNCPAAAPATVGLNLACSVTDWFGLSVTGKVAPDTLKPVPLTVAALMVTGAVPLDVSVTGCVTGTLSGVLPKFTAAGVTVNCGTVVVVPSPPSETVPGPEVSLLVTVSVPASGPAVVGS